MIVVMNVYVNYKIKHRNTNPKDRTNEKIFDGFNSFNSKGRTQAHCTRILQADRRCRIGVGGPC